MAYVFNEPPVMEPKGSAFVSEWDFYEVMSTFQLTMDSLGYKKLLDGSWYQMMTLQGSII